MAWMIVWYDEHGVVYAVSLEMNCTLAWQSLLGGLGDSMDIRAHAT